MFFQTWNDVGCDLILAGEIAGRMVVTIPVMMHT